jgi:hypothetical protein
MKTRENLILCACNGAIRRRQFSLSAARDLHQLAKRLHSRSNYRLRRTSHNSENDHLVCLRSGLRKTVELSASALSSRSVALSCAMGITSKRESATTRRWQL